MRLSEAELVNRLTHWLIRQGYRVRTEVANMGQSTDLVATRGRWVTLIEAKVSHWRRGLDQCRAHETVGDFVCMVIALSSVPSMLRSETEARGYGLVHYDVNAKSFVWVAVPRLNKRVWAPQRRQWARCLRGVPTCQ